jgi:hypothetical protein
VAKYDDEACEGGEERQKMRGRGRGRNENFKTRNWIHALRHKGNTEICKKLKADNTTQRDRYVQNVMGRSCRQNGENRWLKIATIYKSIGRRAAGTDGPTHSTPNIMK